MDINNNQQINTFTKGMNTDTSDAFIGADQYRYAENLRISTDTNSSGGALVPIDGTVRIDNSVCDWDNIIAVTSARDMLVVVGIKKVDELTYMQVYEYNTTDEDLLGVSPRSWRRLLVEETVEDEVVVNTDYNGMLLGNDSSVPSYVSTVVRWESDHNVKLYIADGVHTIMSVRLDKETSIRSAESATMSTDILLQPPIPTITTEVAGNVNAVKVQYAYILLIEGGHTTSLSPISEQVVLYEDESHGYGLDDGTGTSTGKAIRVEIPQETIQRATESNNTITALEVFRIAYLVTGHEPKIDKIYEGSIGDGVIFDNGYNISAMTIEELLAYEASQTRPHEIESKGNYLFLANVSYVKDGIDNKFKDIDTTAPSSGNGAQFKDYVWDPEQWKISGTDQFGGKGKYFQWTYNTTKQVQITYNNVIESGDDLTSLRRGEVYRYGVILYDEHGQASSPKFVADIMIPPESEPGFELVDSFTTNGAVLNRIGITFSVVGNLLQKGVYGWQIVRCHRSYSDKINLFQGICGLPLRIYKDNRTGYDYESADSWTPTHFANLAPQSYLYPGGFMSMQYYRDNWNGLSNTAYTDTNTLMFACPEFCYMEADTENQISTIKSNNLIFEPINCYTIPTCGGGRRNTFIKRGADGPDDKNTVSEFRRLDWYNFFGDNQSSIIPNYDGEKNSYNWLDAYGPTVIRSYAMTLNDCVTTKYNNDYDDSYVQYAAFYYITPTGKCETNDDITIPKSSVNIKDCAPVTVSETQYKSFSRDGNISFMNDSTPIGNSNFINWVASGLDYTGYDGSIKGKIQEASTKTIHTIIDNIGDYECAHIVSNTYGLVRYAATGGKYLLLQAKDDETFGYFNATGINIFPIQIGNIKNAHAIPYGGDTEQSKLNSVYYGDGNFSKDVTPGSYMDVFDGDTYLCMFTYNAAHCFIDEKFWNIPKMSVVYTVPIESSVNLKARSGFLYTDIQSPTPMSRFVQDHPVSITLYEEAFNQTEHAYVYNAAYDSLSSVIKYIPVYYNSVQSNTYDNRIHYTAEKENNELEDKWLLTDSKQFIDVDSRYGAVTNLRLFKDRLIFWQEHATGLLTVNEKTVVQDTTGSDIILSKNSGVVPRYDYISTKYGMKKGQHTDTQSDNALYWWDSDNKELLQYANGLVPLTKAHLVENYINEREESIKPCVGYYCDFDEILANVRRNENNNGETLVFNEKLNLFTGVYTFDPIYTTSIGNDLYLAKAKTDIEHAKMYLMSQNRNRANTILFDNPIYPLVQYIVNNQSTFVKTFDIQTIGGNFYGNGGHGERSTNQEDNPDLKLYPRVTLKGNDTAALRPLTLSYTTPLKQHASMPGDRMTNREYDFRLDIPRNGDSQDWGDRLRGKTMQCEIKSSSNSKEFSLQYVITKYRMSWS